MRGIAYAGAMSRPSVRRSTAAISQSASRARGSDPGRRLSPAPVATHRPAAPSVRGEELPAVSVPLPLARSNAGCSFARRSRLVSARGKLSRERLLVACKRELVLRIARDAPGFRHLLAVLAHALARRAIFDLENMQADIARPEGLERRKALDDRARLRKAPQPVGEILREPDLHAAHAFHPADQSELPAPAPQNRGRFERRPHARRAGEHGRKRRNGPVQARLDLNFARDIRVAEVGNHRAPDEEIGPDSFAHAPPRTREGSCGYGLEPGHRAHHRHRELDGAEPGERPVHPRKRCAQARGEPDVVAVHSGLIMYRIAMPGQACRAGKAGPFPSTNAAPPGISRPTRAVYTAKLRR